MLIASYIITSGENLINAKADLDAQYYANDDAESASYILKIIWNPISTSVAVTLEIPNVCSG